MSRSKKWPEVKQFVPKNPQKYAGDITDIKMRSSWERKFANWCDNNPSVIQWNSEDIAIPYWSSADNKTRTYHVDFIIVMKTASGTETILIEIKPYAQTIKPERKSGKKVESYINECHTYQVNVDKWIHANQYAKDRGWTFKILTEKELF